MVIEMPNNNRGFISTTLVVSIIIISILLIVIIVRRFEHLNAFSTNITIRSRDRLENIKQPNCFWGNPPRMIRDGTGLATSTIVLQCTHIDGIRTILHTNHTTISTNWITRRNATNQTITNNNQLQIDVIRVVAIPNGYRIVFRLQSRTAGNYSLVLNANRITTNDGFSNSQISTRDLNDYFIEVS